MASTPALQLTGDLIVMSRLLILQSRRIMLGSTQRRARDVGSTAFHARVDRLQREADQAHDDYRKSVLAWANPSTSQFWVVAHASLIESAETMADGLRARAVELPISDRLAVETDAREVDGIVRRWRASLLQPLGGLEAPSSG